MTQPLNTITGAGADTRKNRQHSQNIQHYLPIRSFDTTVHYSSGPGLGSRKLGSDKKTINHCSSTARTLIKHGLQMLRTESCCKMHCNVFIELQCNGCRLSIFKPLQCVQLAAETTQTFVFFSFEFIVGFFAFIH